MEFVCANCELFVFGFRNLKFENLTLFRIFEFLNFEFCKIFSFNRIEFLRCFHLVLQDLILVNARCKGRTRSASLVNIHFSCENAFRPSRLWAASRKRSCVCAQEAEFPLETGSATFCLIAFAVLTVVGVPSGALLFVQTFSSHGSLLLVANSRVQSLKKAFLFIPVTNFRPHAF